MKWVKTSWKNPDAGLRRRQVRHCDGRHLRHAGAAKQVFFADKLDTDGKIPLVRCTDVKKYRTLEQINKPSVRLLEPAGGTNEAFVHAYLPKAKLTLTHDNTSIFQQLVDRKADVMITDASEARTSRSAIRSCAW
ncbi:hypothetical protein M8494_29235 [Serratia ureilytica]